MREYILLPDNDPQFEDTVVLAGSEKVILLDTNVALVDDCISYPVMEEPPKLVGAVHLCVNECVPVVGLYLGTQNPLQDTLEPTILYDLAVAEDPRYVDVKPLRIPEL